MHHLYLIPGFFGFANLGELRYFAHVREFLLAEFAARGLTADVQVVATLPTASLPRRAARVAETMASTLPAAGGPVHLIGHSTGGLDARLLLAPGTRLPTDVATPALLGRVRSIVTIATPHHGTPLAAFLTSVLGQRLLQALSLSTIYLLRFGRLPLGVLLELGAVFTRLDGLFGLNSVLLEQLFDQLLDDFSQERRAALTAFFADVRGDQALLTQLAPESMEVFAAVVQDPPGVRCGSVVTQAAPPGVGSQLRAGLDPTAQASHALYLGLHRLARLPPARVPPLDDTQANALRTAYGALPDADANDGVVPTRAQAWGEIIGAVRADHLDVVGHFSDAEGTPPHIDWIATGTGFDRAAFAGVWRSVVDFLLAA